MDVILNATDAERRTFVVGQSGSKIGMKFLTNGRPQNRRAIFGAEDEMNEDARERLRHGSTRNSAVRGTAMDWWSSYPARWAGLRKVGPLGQENCRVTN